jgi:Dolichyl-phosphate-mannose-protein mannosyltransferase
MWCSAAEDERAGLQADDDERTKRRWPLISVVLACTVYCAGLAYYATTRPIDGDEGFYSTAARLVAEGKAPYRDFFYQQAPLLPYLYGWMWAVHPRSLLAMRLISVGCGSIAVFLWGVFLVSSKRLPASIGLATFAAVLLNPYWVSWNVVMKTYAVVNLFVTITMICLYGALHSRRVRWSFFAGLALGACTSVRSLYGPVLIVVLLWLLYHERQTSKPKTLTFLAGSGCGLLPMVVSFVRDPAAFLFNNIHYHRLDAGFMLWDGKIIQGYQSVRHTSLVYFHTMVVRLLGAHPYFAITLIVSIVGGVSIWRTKKSHERGFREADYLYFRVALLMLITYTVVALVPFPPYDQFFDGPLLPFLVPFLAEGMRITWRAGKKRSIALALVAVSLFPLEIAAETAMESGAPVWQLSNYEAVARLIKANSGPDEDVLSFWPGYVFESGRQYFPGLENNFVYRIMNRTDPAEKARYHIISSDRVMSALSRREVKLLVLSPWLGEYENNLSSGEIRAFHETIESNYSLLGRFPQIAIYRRLPAETF